MNEIIEKVRQKLRLLAINSCECHTKTPNPQHHEENCGYRLVREADELLAGLPATEDAKCLRQDKARDYAAGDGFIVRSRVTPEHSTQPCHPSSAERACGHCDAPPNTPHATSCPRGVTASPASASDGGAG